MIGPLTLTLALLGPPTTFPASSPTTFPASSPAPFPASSPAPFPARSPAPFPARPPTVSPPPPFFASAPASELGPRYERRSRHLFIAGAVLLGVVSVGETTGAVISTVCTLRNSCTRGLMYSWGSDSGGTRYTLISTGTGSAYATARVLSVPLVLTSAGLMLAGSHARAVADLASGSGRPPSRRIAATLMGTGIGLYISSRLARLGFALGGVCQEPVCLYAFDRATLSVSRSLAFTGRSLLFHHRTRERVRLGITPVTSLGLGLTGEF